MRAFANRVQPQIGNQRFGRKENRIRRQPHFDPRRLLRLVQGWIDLGAGHFEKSYNVKNVTKVKSMRIALTNADADHRRALGRAISFCPQAAFSLRFWHDSDPVASGFKLNPD